MNVQTRALSIALLTYIISLQNCVERALQFCSANHCRIASQLSFPCRLYEKSNMPNSAAAAYTAACQDGANAGSKELPSAQRYLAQYYLRFSLLDHASHYAYKCLEHETVSFPN